MHDLIESIDLALDKDGNKITIEITDTDENTTEITASVTKSGTFRFSYKHPEDDVKYHYQGVLDDKKSNVTIFPIVGDGVISSKPIPYNIKEK